MNPPGIAPHFEPIPGRAVPLGEYIVVGGSHGYGTATETSDVDFRGFYLPSRQDLFGYRPGSASRVLNTPSIDDALWEVRNFFRMSVQGNPNVLETLFVPDRCVARAGELGAWARENRAWFLSRRLARTYLGYATGNYKRVAALGLQDPFGYDGKDASHLIRLVRMGRQVLKTGELLVDRTATDRDYLIAIKKNQVPFAAIAAEFEEAKGSWEGLERQSILPVAPREADLEEGLMLGLARYVRDQAW